MSVWTRTGCNPLRYKELYIEKVGQPADIPIVAYVSDIRTKWNWPTTNFAIGGVDGKLTW